MKTPQLLKRWWIYPIALVLAIAIVFTVFSSGNDIDTTLTEFTDFVRGGQVTSIRVSRDDRRIEYTLEGSEGTYETRKEARVPLRELLRDAGVAEGEIDRIDIEFGDGKAPWLGLVVNFLPILVILAIVFFFLRQASRGIQVKSVDLPYDPVCNRSVASTESAGTSSFGNVSYRFCSREHKAQFDNDPIKYLHNK